MYSPKIREDLIPPMYQAARQAGVPMTRWVSRLIERALTQEERYVERKEEAKEHDTQTGHQTLQ